MTRSRASLRQLCTLLLILAVGNSSISSGQGTQSHFPSAEKLTYAVEWRLINAGIATVQLAPLTSAQGWEFNIRIESAGLVSRLYRVLDTYKVASSERFCIANSYLDAQEGKKHNISKMNFESARKKLTYEERDLIKNSSEKKESDVAPCTYEIVGALATLRTLNLPPGKSTNLPITDGKKYAQAHIEAQSKENITVAGKSYATTRYEAYLFDNVLYKRHGRLLIWVSDDPEHLPVQFRVLMGFPIGTITVDLQKQEK